MKKKIILSNTSDKPAIVHVGRVTAVFPPETVAMFPNPKHLKLATGKNVAPISKVKVQYVK